MLRNIFYQYYIYSGTEKIQDIVNSNTSYIVQKYLKFATKKQRNIIIPKE